MTIDLDGFKVLHAIVKRPSAFPDISKDASKAAHTLVKKQLTVKSANIGSVRKVFSAIDESAFRLVLDGFTDGSLRSLANKIDKYNAELKTASSSERRRCITELASGAADPASAPPKKTAKRKAPAKRSRVPKRKTKRTLSSEAMSAVWDGTDSDD